MTWLIVDKDGYLRDAELSEVVRSNADFFTQGAENEDHLARDFAQQIPDTLWSLELSKSAIRSCRTELAVCAALETNPDTAVQTERPDLIRALYAARHNQFRLTFMQRAKIFAALCTALLVWVSCVLRFAQKQPNADVFDGKSCLAVHGESSTRTQHVQSSITDASVVIVLGRPKQSLRNVDALFDPDQTAPNKTLLRPISWPAARHSFRTALSHYKQALHSITACGYLPATGDLIGQLFRHIQGTCYSEWWRQAGAQPDTLYFAHTGLADTGHLERAAQISGTDTVHLVHGVSLGWTFASYSTSAYWQCQHDADRHTALGPMGTHLSHPIPKPAFVPTDTGIRIFSNYAHPTSAAYLARGIKPELDLLTLVTAALEQSGRDPDTVTWHLHPSHTSLPAPDLQKLLTRLKDSGMNLRQDPLTNADLTDGSQIVTTPSTIALDALREGRLPIVISTFPNSKDAVSEAFALRVKTADALTKALSDAQLDGLALFLKTFDAIQPSRPMAEVIGGDA